MTGYTVHTGSSEKFSSGWDHIFSGAGGKKKSNKASDGAKEAGSTSAQKKKAATKKGTAKGK
jgi:hypothetical protein